MAVEGDVVVSVSRGYAFSTWLPRLIVLKGLLCFVPSFLSLMLEMRVANIPGNETQGKTQGNSRISLFFLLVSL